MSRKIFKYFIICVQMFFNRVIKSNYPKNIHPDTPEEIDIEDMENEDVIMRFKELGTSVYGRGSNVTLVVIVKNPYYYQPADIALSVSDGTLTQPLFLSVNPEATAMTTVTYTITENDIIDGIITLSLEAEIDGQTFTADYTIDTIEAPNPSMEIVYRTNENDYPNGYDWGDNIIYYINVRNNGNLTLSNIIISSDLTGDTWTISNNLVPGQIVFTEGNEVYGEQTVYNDIVYGYVDIDMNVSATSIDPENPTISETEVVRVSTAPINSSANVTYNVSSPANGSTYSLGEVVTVTPTIENIGNIYMSNIEILNEDAEYSDYLSNSLSPNISDDFEDFTYTITEDDITNGYFTISSDVSWDGSDNESYSNTFTTEIPISDE